MTFKTYLVGGAVRDLVMGIEPKDKDYVVVGATEQDMLDRGYKKVGADFPVFLHPDTGEEYALARVERKVGAGYHGFNVDASKSVTLEQDLMRRDLTMNAMAMDEDGTIIDPFGGKDDIKSKMIRHTSSAFEEDPVRILRACRFAARYNFHIHPDTRAFMISMVNRGELHHVTRERVILEFRKGLSEKHWVTMIRELTACGAADVLRPFHYGYHNVQRITNPYTFIALEREDNFLAKLALATFGFSEMSYKDCLKWAFSTDEAKMVAAINSQEGRKFLTQQGYRQLNAEGRVDLIRKLGLLQGEALVEVMSKLYIWFYNEECFATSHKWLKDDIASLKSIDYEQVSIAAKEACKPIKDEILAAQVAKLNESMSRPKW